MKAALSLAVFLLAASAAGAQTMSRPLLQVSAPSTNPILGGVPSGTATPDTITVTVVDAMRRALEHNLGVILAEDQIGHSSGTRRQTLADLLPTITARVAETRQTTNLAAFGFGSFSSSFGEIPNIIGPFNVFDARVSVRQSLLDLGARNSARSDDHALAAARLTAQGARDLVVHVAGTLYLQALAADARAASVRSQQQTADALYRQALDLKNSGIIAGLEVLRAEVELNTETQRATAASNDAEKARLQLARVMGLPLGQKFALDANLPVLPQPTVTLEQALDSAYKTRKDYQAALEHVKSAEAAVQRSTAIGCPP